MGAERQGAEQGHLGHLSTKLDGADRFLAGLASLRPFAVVILGFAAVQCFWRLSEVAELLFRQQQAASKAATVAIRIAPGIAGDQLALLTYEQ